MISICKHKGYSVEDYYSIAHPVQQEALEVLSRFSDVSKDEIMIGVDGCTVPVHCIPLYNMAIVYARFAKPSDLGNENLYAIKKLTNAIIGNPEMLSGSNAFCTDLIIAGRKNIVGKAEADGVYCISILNEGIGIALKIEDGDMRSSQVAAANVPRQLGLLDQE